MKLNTHKLIRLSLANWYLFESEDVNINGNSILLSGANGSGKSTLLDAIQTIMAGADENKLSFNATTSGAGQQGRSIQSYCLGAIGGDGGGETKGKKHYRDSANTYIAMCFQKPNGDYYSFGCHFYARHDRSSVEKNLFILPKHDITAIDFRESDVAILPYKDFQSRTYGKAEFCNTAKEFREKICQLMSAAGLSYSISPDQLFSTLSKGLRFKQQKDVTEFIRNYILPERNIDVVRIENDYRQYQDILQSIANASDKLERLKRIISLLENWQSQSTKAIGYKWAGAEAKVCRADLALEDMEEEESNLKDSLDETQALINSLKNEVAKLEEARDLALSQKNSSSIAAEVASRQGELKVFEEKSKNSIDIINQCRATLASIEAIHAPQSVGSDVVSQIKGAVSKIQGITRFEKEDALYRWPESVEQFEQTCCAVARLEEPLAALDNSRSGYKDQILEFEKEIARILDTHKKLSNGKASLTDSTLAVIALFEKAGITAKPVCDMAEINDETWQEGIERYLGVWNREALLVVDLDNKPVRTEVLDKALSLYRQVKHEHPRLRSVKILNPEKISTPSGTPAPDTAAALIQSDNTLVLYYLQSLLFGVQLVNTEAELRQHRKAITKDGMTAGNGSISGGNRIDFLLFGESVRRDQAEKLHRRLTELNRQVAEFRDEIAPLDKLATSLSRHLNDLESRREIVGQAIMELNSIQQGQDNIRKALDTLKSSGDFATLESNFQKADEELKACRDSIQESTNRHAVVTKQIADIGEKLPQLRQEIEAANAARTQAASMILFDQTVASDTFDRLQEQHGDEYERIESEAIRKAANHNDRAEKAREDSRVAISEMANYHNMAEGEQWVNLPPAEALDKCCASAQHIEESEITRYQDDAEQVRNEMIQLFRSEITSKLKDNLAQMEMHFRTLNDSLKELKFNNLHFKFIHQLVEVESLKEVHKYITLDDDVHLDTSGGFFDEAKDHPGLKIIEDVIVDGRLKEIADYRNFFIYDVNTKDEITGITRKFSTLLFDGSGGEKQAPFYVVLAASFMNAYKLRNHGSVGVSGGAALTLFDEAMNDMDGTNTAAAMNFFRNLGLQVIVAAPPETSVKIGSSVDRTISVVRQGFSVFLDEYSFTEDAIELMDSDNPKKHPELVDEYLALNRQETENAG